MAVIAQLIGGPLDGQEVDLEPIPDRPTVVAMRFQIAFDEQPTGQVAVYEVKPWRRPDQWALVFAGYEEE